MSNVKESLKYESEYGDIDYGYLKKSVEYPNGLIVLHGSIVHKKWRGQGKFKEMLKMLFNEYPEETVVQAATISKKLTSMFKRIGFKEVDKIEYWGAPANCTTLQGKINRDILKLL